MSASSLLMVVTDAVVMCLCQVVRLVVAVEVAACACCPARHYHPLVSVATYVSAVLVVSPSSVERVLPLEAACTFQRVTQLLEGICRFQVEAPWMVTVR